MYAPATSPEATMSEQTATAPTRDTTYIEAFDIQRLIPYDKNPRKNDDAINAVAESIKAFGFTNPLIINDDKVVCCGHTRMEAAKRLGLTTVPVKIMHGLTDTEFAALNIADNQTGNLAVWDDELLAEQIRDILAAEEPFDVSVLAFDDAELQGLLKSLDFQPGSLEDQGKLDQTDPIICPNCHHEWRK